jgi:hypothetical protein
VKTFQSIPVPESASGSLWLGSLPGVGESLEQCFALLRGAGVTELVCVAHRSQLRVLSPEYALALEEKRVPLRVREFPVDPNGAPGDPAAFGAFALEVAGSVQSGGSVLVHGGETTARSSLLVIATLCELGDPLAVAVERLATFGLCPGNRAQWCVLSGLYGVDSNESPGPNPVPATSAEPSTGPLKNSRPVAA